MFFFFENSDCLHESTGNHRTIRFLGRPWITGPQEDSKIQLICFAGFALAFCGWTLLASFYVWHANILLALNPFFSFVFALGCYLVAGFTDPGICPKLPKMNSPVDSFRWCAHCSREKEVGTFHCESCDVCTRELDHHCGVVGNCVGVRNKSVFISLLFFLHSFFLFGVLNVALSLGYLFPLWDVDLFSFALALWVVGAVESLLLGVYSVDLVLNYYGFGQIRSVHRLHTALWWFLGPHTKLLKNIIPPQLGTSGNGVPSLLVLSSLLGPSPSPPLDESNLLV